jgi:hypothetical protein
LRSQQWTGVSMDTGLLVFELRLIQAQSVLESTGVKTWFKSRSSTDVLVCRAMDSLLVGRLSSYREIAREKHASLYRGR